MTVGIIGGLANKMKERLRGWLEISPAQLETYHITERYNLDTNVIKNRLWMRADPYELQEFYHQLPDDDVTFWGSVPIIGIRKIHSGLPSLIVETLTGLTMRDMNGIEANEAGIQTEIDEILKDNEFTETLKNAVQTCLYAGDGAFKISFDKALSDKAIIEFFPADQVELVKTRSKLKEIVFKTVYEHNKKRYLLKEHYGFGYIKYVLSDLTTGDPVALDILPDTAALHDVAFAGYEEDSQGNVISKGTFMMANFVKIYDSVKWQGRGNSIFDKKISTFDAFDEIISQWADAVRGGRATSYIPENLIPHDPKTGRLLRMNVFDCRYVKTDGNGKETIADKIDVVQPEIKSSNYLESYISFLDICLQGIISPSTLGIDTKKLDNAEAQREKEKTTLATRGNIVEMIQNTIPILMNNVLKAMDVWNGRSVREDSEITVNFGEYASPSFEATVETIGKARTNGIMSVEAAVEEMYGDSKDDGWKSEEVKRLKEEQGISEMSEPSINNVDGFGGVNDDTDKVVVDGDLAN